MRGVQRRRRGGPSRATEMGVHVGRVPRFVGSKAGFGENGLGVDGFLFWGWAPAAACVRSAMGFGVKYAVIC